MTTQIHDPIHGTITITPLMKQIIDTPEFQRLRELKQLGATYFVFPSATHTRFEHSLGVSHLAGKLMETLQKNQPRLQISPREIEITRIAGLIHDIGHGPFSHLYDEHVRNANEIVHEVRGCQLFQHMVQKYKLPLDERSVVQICMMIDPDESRKKLWPYQIIANKLCQIDVDKLDYIRRDCYHLGIEMTSTFSRIITNVRVVRTPAGNEVLGWPKKLEFDIFNVFASRYRLHKQVYNHHTVKAHEFVIVEILRKIKQNLPRGTWQLTDASITCTLHTQFASYYKKIQTRKTPKLVGELVVKLPHKSYHPEDPNPRHILNTIIQVTKIGFAGGDENPLTQVYYYTKKEKNMGFRGKPQDSSFCIPAQHQELIVRMFTNSPNVAAAKKEWEEVKQQWLNTT
jgi:HD superfamily phosphohydrolase